MENLKPCPFCGKSVAEIVTLKELEECKKFEDDRCPAYELEQCPGKKIVCNVNRGGCGASTGFTWDEDKAIAMWNERW